MSLRLLAVTCLSLVVSAPGLAREAKNDPLAQMAFIAGDWTGVSEGEPGTAATTRHATRAQNEHFIMVEGRSVYPRQDKNKIGRASCRERV